MSENYDPERDPSVPFESMGAGVEPAGVTPEEADGRIIMFGHPITPVDPDIFAERAVGQIQKITEQ